MVKRKIDYSSKQQDEPSTSTSKENKKVLNNLKIIKNLKINKF